MKKKLLALVTAGALVLAALPGAAMAAGTSKSEVTVNFSAGIPGASDMVDEQITATGNLAEIYFPDIKANEPDGVSFADVLVAAHIEKYGAGKVQDQLDISNGSWGTQMNKQFGHEIVGAYYVDGTALSGSVSDEVNEGSKLFALAYGNNTYADLFTTFDKEAVKAIAGKKFSIKISSDKFGTKMIPDKASLATVDKYTGKFKSLKTDYKEGTARAAINSVGKHYISVTGEIKNAGYYGETGACVGDHVKVTVGLDKSKITSKKAGKKYANIKWKKVTGAKSYQIFRATKKSGRYKMVKAVKKTSFRNTRLRKNKAYYYKVRAVAKADGKMYKGAFSKIVKVKTKKK